jgi:hypothetical protein
MASSAALSLACAAAAWAMRWILIRKNRHIRQSSDEAVLCYAY